ncbi:2Fe-2S iron-sulfur cluster-binding protein, partial [Cylindrospermopsis raciborskii]
MTVKTLTIDGQMVSAHEHNTLLEAAQESGIHIPTLCHLDGVGDVGACRLCLVEIAGINKLLPACVTKVSEGMEVTTKSDRLQRYRRTIIEMLFAEGNHICSVCVANGNCELQDLAIEMGMDHVRLAYQFPQRSVDTSHERFAIDH